MKLWLIAFIAGMIFALGLGISGMTDANKVIAFLDLADQWDPSLIFVMVGAIATHLIGYHFILRREKPLLGAKFHLPTVQSINGRLLIGSAIFGIGWGLGGYCPGPSIVSGVVGSSKTLVFLAAMISGMLVFKLAHASNR